MTEILAFSAALVVTVGVLVAGGWWGHRVGSARLRYRIAHERQHGHLRLRRRVTNLVGRRQDVFEHVAHAETMPGYVWFRWTRRPREPFVEIVGWAPFLWLARWQLSRLPKGPKR